MVTLANDAAGNNLTELVELKNRLSNRRKCYGFIICRLWSVYAFNRALKSILQIYFGNFLPL